MSRSFLFVFIFLAFNFLIQPTVHAQNEADSVYFSTDTLLVEAVRNTLLSANSPLSLTVSTRSADEISSSGAASLSAITEQLPGIWVNNRQNNALGERITIRGIGWRAAFGLRGIQIVLDGIPLTVADGQSVTNLIDPSLVTRAELIRGPAGSYWGNSSGGILYLSTMPPTSQQPVYIKAQAGSYGERKGLVRFSESYGNHDFSAYTSYQFQNGYRDYSASKLFRSGIHGSYQISPKDHIEYTAAFLDMPKAQHPSGLTAEQAENDPRQANEAFVASGAGKQVTQGQLGLSYHRDSDLGLLTLTGYGIYRDLSNPLPFGIITVDRRAGGIRGTLEKKFDNLRISGGAELKFQHDDREEFQNDDGARGATTVNQIEDVRNEALFLTSRYRAGRLELLASMRYDRITFSSDSAGNVATGERTFQAFSPGIGLGYSIGTSTLYSNLSTSFEAPTTTELVNRPDGGNGFNSGLQPERTIGLEAGSRGSFGKGFISYDLAFYQLWISDLLFPYQLEANGPVFYRNQGETRHSGLEFTSTVYPRNDLSLNLTYTLTNARFEEAQTLDSLSLSGKQVPGIAKHRISGGITWKPDNLRLQLNGRYADSYPVDNLNEVSNDAYLTVDSNVSYKITFSQSNVTLTPFLNVNNIFDTAYNGSVVVNAFGGRYFEPAPGRNWQAGISMNF